jgi:membrane dipeptidase
MHSHMIVDAHEDIAYNALALGRDFRTSALEKRAAEGDEPREGLATIGLPEALRGNVRVIFSTLYAAPASSQVKHPGKSYSTPEEAEEQAREQLAYYTLLGMDSRIALITTRAGLEDVVSSPEPRIGLVLLMEGADPILQPDDVVDWFKSGVRVVGPAWHRTRYAGGTGAPGPLTDLGRALMSELSRAGFILDTSHLAEASFFEALDLFEGTVIASHSNARALVPTDRQLSDDMVRALVARDGVIGTVFYNQFLRNAWHESGGHKEQVSLSTVVNEIRYVCDLAGDTRHVGIGTDFDGGFGAESTPVEIDTVADLQQVGQALSAANFGDKEVENILCGNWLRMLRRALPAD